MDKKNQALLLGGFIALAGLPLTASAQTPSTASPYTVTESAPFTENWSGVGTLLGTDVWTVEDKNNDNYTWEDLGTGTPAYNGANASQTADDWLVSPPLYLQAGTSYTLETGGFCGVFSGAAQRLEVAFGTGDDPTTYDQFVAPTPITGYTMSTGATPVKGVFTPSATGTYRIGFHAISEQAGYLLLSSVRVSVTANTAGTPVKVSDLTLQAGENAEPTVKVSFTAPTKDITNRDLTSLTSCTVYRDDSTLPVYTFTAPTPGRELCIPGRMEDIVLRYAENAKAAGLDGVVCSPLEVPIIHRECGNAFLTVTPGIRFADGEKGDQARITTPAHARSLGSDFIVVGRPITASPDPAASYLRCVSEFSADPQSL